MAKNKKKEAQGKWWTQAGNARAQHVEKRRFGSVAEAKTAAANKMGALQRGEFEGDITIPGNPDLAAGVEVTLEGFSPEAINGRYMAKSVKHSISRSGWTTQSTLENLS